MSSNDDESAREESDPEEGISLEELSQSYANVIGVPLAAEAGEQAGHIAPSETDNDALSASSTPAEATLFQVTPATIVEAVLFVGHSDGTGITAATIAEMMRGVDAAEVTHIVAELNREYEATNSALRIEESADGFRTVLADGLSNIRERFYGRIAEAVLNQSAIDCLALIAYQPGISRQELDEQRGSSNAGLLNQLVRQQLVEVKHEGEGKGVSRHYYPTPKLLKLAGLQSIDDLPQVEEFELEQL